MKKSIIFVITLLALTSIIFTGCAPSISPDKYDLTGSYGAGVSGTPAIAFDPLEQDSKKPIKYQEIVVQKGEVEWKEDYYTTTLSLATDANGKMVERRETITYINVISDESKKPTNWEDFQYISTAMPKEIYEIDYRYTPDRKSLVGAPSNGTRPLDFVVNGHDWIHEKLYAFIRYVYLQTNGGVNLTFTYDTSFNYQTNEFGGGIVIRGLLTITNSTLNQTISLNDLLNARVGGDTLIGVFNHTGNKLGIKPITDVEVTTNASTWCDIQIGVPNASASASDLWEYMLTYYNQI